jgi:chromosome segregation ATPase
MPTQAETKPAVVAQAAPQSELERLQEAIRQIDAEQASLGDRQRPLLRRQDQLHEDLQADGADGWINAPIEGGMDAAERRVTARRQLDQDRPVLVEFARLSAALDVRRQGLAREIETVQAHAASTRAQIKFRRRTIAQKAEEIEHHESLIRSFRAELANYERDVEGMNAALVRLVGEEG